MSRPLRGIRLALLRSLSMLAASRLAIPPSCSAVALLSVPASRGVGRGAGAAVAARSSRFAGRGRWSVAVATLVPAARVFARSRRCCGSPSGSRSRLHPRPYSAQSLNPKPILKVKRFNTPHPPKMEKGVPESTL